MLSYDSVKFIEAGNKTLSIKRRIVGAIALVAANYLVRMLSSEIRSLAHD
jgi:hypothetical protein